MAERRLIDAAPHGREPELTAHLRRVAAPVPLDSAARARIAAALRTARPERRRPVALFAFGAGVAVAALLALALAGRGRRTDPEGIAQPTAAPALPRALQTSPVSPAAPVAELAPIGTGPTALPVERSAKDPIKRAAEKSLVPADKPVVLSEGTMLVRAADHSRSIETPLGMLTVRPGSVVEIKVRASRVQVAAWQGSAQWSDGTHTIEIATGVAWSSDSAQALELLAQAIAKLRRAHDPDAALALLAQYRQLSDGELSQEASLLEAEALLAAGREEQALRALEALSLEGRADLSAARDRLRKKLSGSAAP
jgi:hypothetical protein